MTSLVSMIKIILYGIVIITIIIKNWRHNIIISKGIVIFPSIYFREQIIMTLNTKRIFKPIIPKLGVFHIMIRRNMNIPNSITIINIIIFTIGAKKIFEIISSIIFPIMIITIRNGHNVIFLNSAYRLNIKIIIDNLQEQGITIAPLNVEEGYRSARARRKSYLFPTTKVSQVLVDYALNKFKE